MGKLITVEGGEGVGKSTLISGIVGYLKRNQVEAISTSEPGGSPTADLIRQVFTHPKPEDPLNIQAEFLLVSASRSQHVQHMKDNYLSKDIWVICDRFSDSSRVYQGHVGGIEPLHIESIINFSTMGLEPDLTLLLDCPVDVSIPRVKSDQSEFRAKKGAKRFDEASLPFHQKIRDGFLKVQADDPERVQLVDASRSHQDVLDQSLTILKGKFFS